MNSPGKVAVAITGLLAVTLGAVSVWYALATPEDQGEDERDPPSQAFVESSSRAGFSVLLMPVATDVVTDREPGEEVWDELLAGITADPVSLRLFSRLYGGVPVRFLADPFSHDDLTESPGSEFPVIVSVKATRLEDTLSQHEGHVYGVLDVIRMSKLPMRPQPSTESLDSVVSGLVDSALADDPVDTSILLLVVNDYLLRHHPGWQLFSRGIFSADDIELPTGGPSEIRADLDRRIEDFESADGGDSIDG